MVRRCLDMVEILLPEGSSQDCRSRIERAGCSVVRTGIPPVPALDMVTAHRVVLIPASVFGGSQWPLLRVELSRSARFFVAEVARSETALVVEAMRDGAFDVVSPGDTVERWKQVLSAAADSQRLWLELYAGRLDTEGQRLVGRSEIMKDLRRNLERLGPTDVTVLVLGESGVGKERVAAALHEAGRGGPLVTLNCAAMPRELIEAELFGAEKGAFTGAVKNRPGLVEQANGGTLFLDEVGEMDLTVQPKLLRFLETRRARRVGGESEYSVRVRVAAATNRDLEREVKMGRFRADLFYRLAEVVIRIPPLRERKDDIPDLVRAFIGFANERFGKNVETVEPALLLRLQQYSWPGNIRELKGVVDRLVLFHEGPVLRAGWWEPPPLVEDYETETTGSGSEPVGGGGGGRAGENPGGRMARPSEGVTPSGGGGFGGGGGGGGGGAGEGSGGMSLPGRTARLELAKRLLDEGRMSLSEVAARVGVHPTTLFRWRKSGKAGGAGRDEAGAGEN